MWWLVPAQVDVEVEERCGSRGVQGGGQAKVDGLGWRLVKEGSCCDNRWQMVLWAGSNQTPNDAMRCYPNQADYKARVQVCSVLWNSGKTTCSRW